MVHTRACRPAPRPAEVDPTAPGVRLSAVGQDRNLHLLDPHDKAAATRRRGAGASGRCVQTTTHFIIINCISIRQLLSYTMDMTTTTRWGRNLHVCYQARASFRWDNPEYRY